MKHKSGAPAVARERSEALEPSQEVTLSTGIRAIIKPVPSALIDAVSAKIPEPEPPVQFIENKGREEANPLDPTYLKEVRDVTMERGRATTEALVMFGIELVEGIPPDEEWLNALKHLEKRGRIDLSSWDLDDPFEKEYVYKAFVAVAQPDLERLMIACGLLEGEVAKAEASFPGQEIRAADPTIPADQ